MGCYDDIEAADAFVLWGSNMAEMHPILWTRVTDRRLSAPKTKVAVLSTFEHRSYELADIELIFTPQTDLAILNYIANHIIKTNRVNRDFVDEAHRRSSSATPTSATACGPSIRCRRPRRTRAMPSGSKPMNFDEFAKFVSTYDLDYTTKLTGVPEGQARAAGRAVRRSEDQGDVVLDHGFQPAHARRVVQQHGLQPPPADRQDRDAGQQPVLADRPAVGLRHGARGRHLLASPAGRHGRDQSRAPRARRGNLEAAARARFPTSPAITRCCRTACSRTASSTPTG